MYKKIKPSVTGLKVNTSYEGETIESKIRRIVNNKEPISDGAPLIYTDRKDGVRPEYDVRTDRFEIATEAMDTITKSKIAQREERHKSDEQRKSEAEQNKLKKAQEKADAKAQQDLLKNFGDPDSTQATK